MERPSRIFGRMNPLASRRGSHYNKELQLKGEEEKKRKGQERKEGKKGERREGREYHVLKDHITVGVLTSTSMLSRPLFSSFLINNKRIIIIKLLIIPT